jgi:hypothetical protein
MSRYSKDPSRSQEGSMTNLRGSVAVDQLTSVVEQDYRTTSIVSNPLNRTIQAYVWKRFLPQR